MAEFDFRGTSLELCDRAGCVHYRGEHKPACTAPARDENHMMIPGTSCPCGEFVPPLPSRMV